MNPKRAVSEKHVCCFSHPNKRTRRPEPAKILALEGRFVEQIDELTLAFQQRAIVIKVALDYLKQNFHQQVSGRTAIALRELHSVVQANCRICAQYIQQFIEKDKTFSFAHLPRDIRKMIISYLGPIHYWKTKDFFKGDRNQLILDWKSHNNKGCYDVFQDGFFINNCKEFKEIKIHHGFRENEYPAEGLLALQKLELNCLTLKKEHVDSLYTRLVTENLPNLKVECCCFDETTFVPITRMSCLRELKITNMRLPSFVPEINRLIGVFSWQIPHLTFLTKLKIDLYHSYDQGWSMESFSSLTNLTSLEMNFTNHIRNFECISSFSNLTHLNLGRIIDQSLDALVSMTKLQSLAITSYEHNRVNLRFLTALNTLTKITLLHLFVDTFFLVTRVNLKSLKIQQCRESKVNMKVLSLITGLTKLDLSINWWTIDKPELRQISKLTRLIKLNLSNNHIPNKKALNFLSSLRNLETLKCVRIGMTGKDEISLVKLTSLRKLKLNDNDLRSSNARYLSQLTNLTYLNLFDAKMTKQALSLLVVLPKLEYFDWRSCLPQSDDTIIEKLWRKRFIED